VTFFSLHLWLQTTFLLVIKLCKDLFWVKSISNISHTFYPPKYLFFFFFCGAGNRTQGLAHVMSMSMELHHQPFVFFETGSSCWPWTLDLLPQSLKCWDYRLSYRIFILSFCLVVPRFELRASCLLPRRSYCLSRVLSPIFCLSGEMGIFIWKSKTSRI
jgi:hypothetical protein